jgi:peptidoglycan/xylan/chitin deacetylase (PgdA/CDA1 family)
MKRFFYTIFYRMGLTRALSRRTRKQVKILCYHSVSVQPESAADPFKLHISQAVFRSHLEHLRNNYQVIALRDYVTARNNGRTLPPNAVVLTFDDGFRNFQTVAAPLLSEFGFPATVFIITSKTDTGDAQARAENWQNTDDIEHLTWREVQSLTRSPLFQIGSHTHTHQRLPTLSLAEAAGELSTSLKEIENYLGDPCPPLSYPHGRLSGPVKQLARELGHSCALSSELGGNDLHSDLFALRRVVIASDDDVPTFAARVAGVTWRKRNSVLPIPGERPLPAPLDACPKN